MVLFGIAAVVIALFALTALIGAPYVPSHRRDVARAFSELRPLDQNDVVVDLGSGDGVVLAEAIKAGAGRAVGFEINPVLVIISRLVLLRYKNTQVRWDNMWSAVPPRGVTVLYAFTVGRDTSRLVRLAQQWADQTSRPIALLVYGHVLPTDAPSRTSGAHHIYEFTPLQP